MLSDWITTHMRDDKTLSVWCTAWWRLDGRVAAKSSGKSVYVLQIAPWHPQIAERGKYVIMFSGDRMTISEYNRLPPKTIPHIFDTLEEAQAVYDLIVDKE